MDGGRILRAGMTKVVGRHTGTRVAVIVGEAFALLLLLFSIFVVQSVILALLAVFIMVVAFAEDRAVRVETAMRRLRVGQFALWDMGGLSPEQPLAYALRGGPRDVAVTVDGRVVGMLWRNELLAELSRTGPGRTVGDVMDRDPVTVDIDTPMLDVQRLMTDGAHSAIPVTEAGRYRGVFTADRFLHVYRQLAPDPIRELREFVSRRAVERLRA
jgi:CBS domain-containing protein